MTEHFSVFNGIEKPNIGTPMKPEDMAGPIAMKERRPVMNQEMGVLHRDGSTTWLGVSANPLFDNDNNFLGVVGTFTDISARKKAEQNLKNHYKKESALRKELEAEMKRRAEFTRALVHELKTPLTPIVASSDVLVEAITEQTLHAMAENINKGALNLSKRIDELLDIARSELNVLKITPQPLEPILVVEEVVSEMGVMAKSNGQTLKLKLPTSLPLITADRSRIKQVIENILTNALKFTPEGGEICIGARQNKGDVIIEIKDTGPGLTNEERARVFHPYYRKESDRDHLSGLGLGLAICKKIIDLHNGRIWVKNRRGGGSIFGFSIPLNT